MTLTPTLFSQVQKVLSKACVYSDGKNLKERGFQGSLDTDIYDIGGENIFIDIAADPVHKYGRLRRIDSDNPHIGIVSIGHPDNRVRVHSSHIYPLWLRNFKKETPSIKEEFSIGDIVYLSDCSSKKFGIITQFKEKNDQGCYIAISKRNGSVKNCWIKFAKILSTGFSIN